MRISAQGNGIRPIFQQVAAGGDRETAPAAGADNGLVLADLRGRSYRDPLWSDLLDQLTFSSGEELRLALFECAYKTGATGRGR